MADSPSLIAAQAGRILALLNAFRDFATNRVIAGGAVSDGGTTQATGAGGALNFDVDTAAVDGVVVAGRSFPAVIGAGTDVDSDAGTQVTWTAVSGQSVVFALVLQTTATGLVTPAYEAVAGAVAVTGQEVPPTDAEIEAALGHTNFVISAYVTVNRTGDTAVTVAIDHQVDGRVPMRGIPQLSTTEVGFAAGV